MLLRSTAFSTLSLHDALPIFGSAGEGGGSAGRDRRAPAGGATTGGRSTTSRSAGPWTRSEEHTSELQSPYDLVCRLLLEKKKYKLALLPLLLSCFMLMSMVIR